MRKITIIVVDDHPLFRQGVIDSFSLEPDFEVVGQTDSGEKAYEIIKQLQPDVAVLDVNLPGLNGQQLTRQVVIEKLQTKVVLLTAYDDTEQVIHAMRVGAHAYSAKDVEPEKLIDIIRNVSLGYYYVGDQRLDQKGVGDWLQERTDLSSRPYSDPGEPFYPLSAREMEVLECVTLGLSNKEIATKLGISHQTVKNHVTAILRKLNVEDRTQAAVYSLRRGWVRLYDQDAETEE
ncbi:MAG TPA: response regulator transcription factor [Anaerolineales bacterium]|jgi:DNA-binding NarL/FixJ family response regulator|nr:response regulator transcription factor [Anaerolineales bacterium]